MKTMAKVGTSDLMIMIRYSYKYIISVILTRMSQLSTYAPYVLQEM